MAKLTDTEFIARHIAGKIRQHIERKWMTMTDLADRLWVSVSVVSATLNWKSTSTNSERYEKLAIAAWMGKAEFESIVADAKRAEIEHSLWKEDMDENFALKSLVWNSPEAQAEAKSVIQYIKQKYGLK